MMSEVKIDPKILATLRKSVPLALAESLVHVQQMDSTVVRDLYNAGMTTEQLKAAGYEPVSELGLMWTKKEKADEGSK
jgi:hypothetical protein